MVLDADALYCLWRRLKVGCGVMERKIEGSADAEYLGWRWAVGGGVLQVVNRRNFAVPPGSGGLLT